MKAYKEQLTNMVSYRTLAGFFNKSSEAADWGSIRRMTAYIERINRDNLHSLWAGQELYRKGNSEEEFMNILQKNMQPVYDSARRQGYEVWNRG